MAEPEGNSEIEHAAEDRWAVPFVEGISGPNKLKRDLRFVLGHGIVPYKQSHFRSPDRKMTLYIKQALRVLKKKDVTVNDPRVVSLMLYLEGFTRFSIKGERLYGDRLINVSKALKHYAHMKGFGFPLNKQGQLVDSSVEGRSAYILTLTRILNNRDISEPDCNHHLEHMKAMIDQVRYLYSQYRWDSGVRESVVNAVSQFGYFYYWLGRSVRFEDCQHCGFKRCVKIKTDDIYHDLRSLNMIVSEEYNNGYQVEGIE